MQTIRLHSFRVNIVEGGDLMSSASPEGMQEQRNSSEKCLKDFGRQLRALTSQINDLNKFKCDVQGMWTLQAQKWIRTHWKWCFGFFVASLAIVVSIYIEWYIPFQKELFNSRVEDVLKQRNGVMDSLHYIGSNVDKANTALETLKPFIDDLVKESMQQHASLTQPEFNKRLPSLSNTLALGTAQGANLPPDTIKAINQKLLRAPDSSPNYWNAIANFVSYRSRNAITLQPKPQASDLPVCTDSDPHPFQITKTGQDGGVKEISSPYYENCQLSLDSPQQNEKILQLVHKDLTIVFKNCLITYSGGHFTLPVRTDVDNIATAAPTGHGTGLRLSYHGPSLQFVNCLFRISATSATPGEGKSLLKNLLASGNSAAVLPLSPPA